MTTRIALVQTTSDDTDPDAAFEAALTLAQRAGDAGAELIVLPELWTGLGMTPARPPERIAARTPEADARLAALADSCGAVVTGSTYRRRDDGRLANTAAVHAPGGEMWCYDKTHLFDGAGRRDLGDVGNESDKVEAGGHLEPFDTKLGPIGVTICSDLRFPEPYRLLALRGARILVNCSAFLSPRQDHWEFMLRTRAVENQCYLVASGQFGHEPASGLGFVGRSMVVDPWGVVVATASDRVGLTLAEIDLDLVDDVRAQFPLLRQRRPELYADLAAETDEDGLL